LSEFKQYTFAATGADLTVGRSIASFSWDFGDGTKSTVPAAKGACTLTHAFQSAGSFTVSVSATDDQGLTGTAATQTETVVSATSPVTVSVTAPASAITLQVQVSGSVQYTFKVSAATSTPGATVPASNLAFNAGDTSGTNYTPPQVGTIIDNGDGTFNIPVTFYASASTGSRTANPTITATDSAGNNSALVTIPAITISSTGVNHPPSVLITQPATTPTNAFTSKQVTLAFTLTDPDGDVVSYDVNWGDGTTPDSTGTTGSSDTTKGVAVSLTHPFPDSFPTGTASTVKVTANDGRTTGALPFATTVFNVTFNTYPTATITSPQGSGTLPTAAQLVNGIPAGVPAGLVDPPIATSPDLVVIPIHGQLTFSGTATLPGSLDTSLTYSWSFPNGTPSSSNQANPGQVFFNGVAGQYTPCLVTFTVTDAFGRNSSGAAAVNVKTFQKWVIVDGINTQAFTLGFLYRQKSDTNGVTALNQVQTQANGAGVPVQVFQDGSASTWTVQSGNLATVDIPVRSNLPFYVQIPPFAPDTRSYMVRIPNAPTGSFMDPTLETNADHLLPAGSEGFGFEDPTGATSSWWHPNLQIVTAQGFTPEGGAPPARFLSGDVFFDRSNINPYDMEIGKAPVNSRWVDRLSVPLTDANAVQWEQDSNSTGSFSNLSAYQIAEWPIVPLTEDSHDIFPLDVNSTVQGKPADLGFNINYATYANSDSQHSLSFLVNKLQAFRAPVDPVDPFDLDAAGWNFAPAAPTPIVPTCVSLLNPTSVNALVPVFFENMVYQPLGTLALSGGLQNIPIPYQPTDVDRTPLAQVSYRNFDATRSIFSYSEYLWSSVWVRPLVLNSAQLNYTDSEPGSLHTYPFFRYANPTVWPKYLSTNPAIIPDNSYFDLTVTGGPTFTVSSPVGFAANPSTTGVGRFYWTAYTPSYNAEAGAVVSRTWLSLGATQMPPTTFPSAKPTDATSAMGFVTPQDTLVDKRARNADGSLVTPQTVSGGYRVLWLNPTVDSSGNPVPPDFWVVEMSTPATNSNPAGGTFDFMLPGNFPGVAAGQTTSAPILTDARTYLPSGNSPGNGPAMTKGVVTDSVAPGYCWFDVPPELRPATGAYATITVFALKAVTSNNAVAGARALNRTDWIDAIKTATAQISIIPSSGNNVSFAHKIPFNYPWDIVVVNGPSTFVKP
jgi:hypothetical protein